MCDRKQFLASSAYSLRAINILAFGISGVVKEALGRVPSCLEHAAMRGFREHVLAGGKVLTLTSADKVKPRENTQIRTSLIIDGRAYYKKTVIESAHNHPQARRLNAHGEDERVLKKLRRVI